MDRVLPDVRLAIRMLVRRPAFTILALITLTIGVGANTAVFSLINGIFLKPLPLIRETDSLVEIAAGRGNNFADVSYTAFAAMRADRRVLVDAAAYTPVPVSIGSVRPSDEPVVRMALNVTGNYFALLGVAPGAGRFFAPNESFPPSVVLAAVISHRLWQERFSSDAGAIGRTIRVNGHSLEIIGVAPATFRGHTAAYDADVYVPLGVEVPGMHTIASLADPTTSSLQVLGRLQPDVSREQAAAALSLSARGADTLPVRLRIDAFSPVPAVVRSGVTAFLGVLLALSALLLTMTCVNVAGMILSRATERRTEIAIRRALGATRGIIVRQLLTESAVLFLMAGVTGALLAAWLTPLLMTFKPPLPAGFSIDLDLGADWRVLAYSALIATMTGVVFSIAPALRATNPDLVPALREMETTGGRARTRLRSVLVATQMAATVLLLIVAGLFVRALSAIQTLDPGWDARGVYVTSIDLESTGMSPERGRVFYAELTRRIGAIPGVQTAALAAKLPFAGSSSLGAVNVEGMSAPDGRPGFNANFNRVSPGYFRSMGVPLLRGRDVRDADDAASAKVAVINEAMATRLWPNADPVGRQFWVGEVGKGRPLEVIGIVKNTKYRRLVEETPNFYFLPYRQLYNAQMTLHVRVAPGAPSAAVIDAVTAAMKELAPDVPLASPKPLGDALAVYFLPQRIAAWVAGVMGLIGMLIGVVGVYAVAAIAVAQRRRELGIRLALGARPSDVVALLLNQGMRAPLVGQLIGFILALVVTRMLGAFLGVVSPVDPITFGSVAIGLGVVTAIATWAPARRAAALDPVQALRQL